MLLPKARETSSTGQAGQRRRRKWRDEESQGKEQRGGCESSCWKDWFEHSTVTTVQLHPIRPLFQMAGSEGQECIFVCMENSLRRELKNKKEGRGVRKREQTCGVVWVCCQMPLRGSLTSLSSNRNNGGCRETRTFSLRWSCTKTYHDFAQS